MTLARRGKILLAGAATYWLLAAQVSGNLAINRYGFLFVLLACTELACDRYRAASDDADVSDPVAVGDGGRDGDDSAEAEAAAPVRADGAEDRLFESPLTLLDG